MHRMYTLDITLLCHGLLPSKLFTYDTAKEQTIINHDNTMLH